MEKNTERKHGNNGTTQSQPRISEIPFENLLDQEPGGILNLPFPRDTSTLHR
jgi:hypothetical protein